MTPAPSPPPSDCPDPETLAAFVDGSLATAEKMRVEIHAGECETCYFVVEGVSAWKDESASLVTRIGRPGLRMVAGWVGTLVGGMALLWLASEGLERARSPAERPAEEVRDEVDLASVVGAERLLTARLTGGFDYAPQPPLVRGARSGEESWALYEAASRLRRAVERSPTPEALERLGGAYLLLGDHDEAIQTLEEAAREAPGHAGIRSDLAAAFHERASAGKADDFLAAFGAADEAVVLEPSLEEALFNRALALESLHLRQLAREAWRRFLETDPAPGWASEGRDRLTRLETRARGNVRETLLRLARQGDAAGLREHVFNTPAVARELLQSELLPAWGRAVLADRREEAGELGSASLKLGQLLTQRTGDPFLGTVVDEIRDAEGGRAVSLARAHLALSRSGEAWNERDLRGAELGFGEATVLFRETDSVLSLWAEVWERVARTALAPGESDASRFDDLLAPARQKEFRLLVAQVRAHQGTGLLRAGRSAESIRPLVEARKTLEALGERAHASFLRVLLAEAYRDLGNESQSWSERLRGLEAAIEADSPRLGDLLLGAASSALARAEHSAALAFLEERSTLGFDESPGDEVLTRTMLSRLHLELDEPGRAREEWERSRRTLHRIVDERIRLRAESDVRLLGAELAIALGRREDVTEQLDRAEEAIQALGHRSRLPALALLRARAGIAGAEELLLEGLAIAEEAPSLDDPWFSGHQLHRELIEELVRARWNRGDRDGAWRSAERERTRSESGLTLRDLGGVLRGDEEVHYYFSLPERLLHWRVTRESTESRAVELSRDRLEAMVDTFSRGLRADPSGARILGGELYQALLASEGDSRPGRLVFVLDVVLEGLPVAALVVPGPSRYLVVDSVLTVAPDATTIVGGRRGSTLDPRPPRSVLAVGDPELDALEFPDLPLLPRASREAESVAALYGDARLLLGAEAGVEALLRELQAVEVLHFSGHAVAGTARPGNSHLALATSATRGGALFADEIRAADLSGLYLVALSACGTASGAELQVGSRQSLADAFLSAGARAVVASMWPVVDDRSSALQMELHRAILQGKDAAAALRLAQRSVLESGGPESHPVHWAGLRIMGG